jgi:SAM-dependent methyltransferase
MYLRERLARLPAGHFVEIGPGKGDVTNLLLNLGWRGELYDLSEETGEHLRKRFAREIAEGRLTVNIQDFLQVDQGEISDLVISCMVMEHLDEANETGFMNRAIRRLRPGGKLMGLVPASPEHWNIEDEIAGHYRRYTRRRIDELCESTGWSLEHVAGLTYPISNILLPLSNFLVKMAERNKTKLSMLERTRKSGHRNVLFKTNFPSLFSLFLNEYTFSPLNFLQKYFSQTENALVILFEATPNSSAR